MDEGGAECSIIQSPWMESGGRLQHRKRYYVWIEGVVHAFGYRGSPKRRTWCEHFRLLVRQIPFTNYRARFRVLRRFSCQWALRVVGFHGGAIPDVQWLFGTR